MQRLEYSPSGHVWQGVDQMGVQVIVPEPSFEKEVDELVIAWTGTAEPDPEDYDANVVGAIDTLRDPDIWSQWIMRGQAVGSVILPDHMREA